MKGILVVFVVGAMASAASFLGSTFFVEAFTPFIAMVTGLGMLTAWLIASDQTPKAGRETAPPTTQKRAA